MTRAAQIRAALAVSPSTCRDLADLLGAPMPRIFAGVGNLCRRGKARKTGCTVAGSRKGRNLYELTPRGRAKTAPVAKKRRYKSPKSPAVLAERERYMAAVLASRAVTK